GRSSNCPPKSRRAQCTSQCPLWANSGHWPVSFRLQSGRRDTAADRRRTLQRLLRRTFLQLLHHFVHVEAGRLLPLRIVPERQQELAHIVLRGDKKEGVIQ